MPLFVCQGEGRYARGGVGERVGGRGLFILEEVDVDVFEGYAFEVRCGSYAGGA